MKRQKSKSKFGELEREKILQAAKRSLRKPEGKKALDYLKNKRRFSDLIIDKFDFGYCPLNINHQLKNRIIIPIYDTYGELIVLSTRHLDEKNPKRFWHESFNKSFYIYALFYAKSSIIRYKKAILVEGEFDVAALHSNNFTMAIGICGSALTLSQIVLLSRYCSDVFLVFDGDEAGRIATKRAMELYKKYNLDCFGIHFIPVFLPSNMDPDEYVKEKGKEEFKNVLKQAKEEYKF